MGLSKPYYRIVRPKSDVTAFVTDPRYATDRLQLSRAYMNIENELRKVFEYIEPDDDNNSTFSFALYSLLLRACTEVESNCRLIMQANGATPGGKRSHFTMEDYVKLDGSSKLSKYIATFPNWRKNDATLEYISKDFCPFANFDAPVPKAPDWYSDYNKVKHNREENLEKANLTNCMNAVAGILILLYSQFGAQCIDTYGNPGGKIYFSEDNINYDFAFSADTLFVIKPPEESAWLASELYDFDWEKIKGDSNPFDKYPF